MDILTPNKQNKNMSFSKKHRQILSELCGYCNQLGGVLDRTSTSTEKYIDRQTALMLVYKVLYGCLVDSPENDTREDNMADAIQALSDMQKLTEIIYPDKNGVIKY